MGWFSNLFGSNSGSSSVTSSSTKVESNVDIQIANLMDTQPIADAVKGLTDATNASGATMVQKIADTVTTNTKSLVDGFQQHLDDQQRMQMLLAGVTAVVALMKDR